MALLFICVLLRPTHIMHISRTVGLWVHLLPETSGQRYALQREFLTPHSHALGLLLGPG